MSFVLPVCRFVGMRRAVACHPNCVWNRKHHVWWASGTCDLRIYYCRRLSICWIISRWPCLALLCFALPRREWPGLAWPGLAWPGPIVALTFQKVGSCRWNLKMYWKAMESWRHESAYDHQCSRYHMLEPHNCWFDNCWYEKLAPTAGSSAAATAWHEFRSAAERSLNLSAGIIKPSVATYTYIYICNCVYNMYIYIYIYIYILGHMHACRRWGRPKSRFRRLKIGCVYVYIYIYIYILHLYTCIPIYLYTYIPISTYMCVYVCIYIYTHTYTHRERYCVYICVYVYIIYVWKTTSLSHPKP